MHDHKWRAPAITTDTSTIPDDDDDDEEEEEEDDEDGLGECAVWGTWHSKMVPS